MEIPLPLPPPVHFASMIDVPGKEGKEGGAVHSSRSLMMAVSRGGGGRKGNILVGVSPEGSGGMG